MNALDSHKTECPDCFQTVDATDSFCRRCGQPLHSGAVQASTPNVYNLNNPSASAKDSLIAPPVFEYSAPSEVQPEQEKLKASENPLFVLGMLLFILGPFALPLLWRSRAFHPYAKIAITGVVVFITAYVTWTLYGLFSVLYERLSILGGNESSDLEGLLKQLEDLQK